MMLVETGARLPPSGIRTRLLFVLVIMLVRVLLVQAFVYYSRF